MASDEEESGEGGARLVQPLSSRRRVRARAENVRVRNAYELLRRHLKRCRMSKISGYYAALTSS